MKEFQIFRKKLDSVVYNYKEKTAIEYMLENGHKKLFSYGEVYKNILSFADIINDRGVKPGDRVAILTPHSPYGIATCIACAYWNLTSVLFDASLPEQELGKLLKLSDVRAIFTTKKFSEMGCVKRYQNIPVFDIEQDDFSYPVFEGYAESVLEKKTEDPDEDVIAILFSSGTTSSMKGIMITYKSIPIARDIFADLSGLKSEMSYLLVLPFNHIAGFTGAMTYLLTGCTLGLIENVNAAKLQKGLLEFQPSYFAMVPKVYEVMEQKIRQAVKEKGKAVETGIDILLMFSGFLRKYFGINIGRKIFSPILSSVFGQNIFGLGTGATPCKEETAKFFINMGVEWANLYATTETGVPIAATGIHDRYPVGTVGNVRRENRIDVMICNPDKKGCGEICVRSPLLMKGYFREPELSEKAFENGYFKTGDYGYIDKKGYLYVTGRIKESILLHNGKKVSPVDVDTIYQKNVPEGCVVASCGINCKGRQYDEIYLFVERKKACKATENDIRNSIMECSAKMSENYRVQHIQFVEHIPYTSVGKVKRYLLKELLADIKGEESEHKEDKKHAGFEIDKYPKKKRWYHRAAFKVAVFLSRSCWDFEVEGVENIPESDKYIICPNHQSHLDGLFVLAAMGQKKPSVKDICCMAKYEHLFTRFSRFWMTMLGGIPVDRTGNTAITLRRIETCLKNGNYTLLIHPEGTRTRNGSLNKFKEGAALLAVKSGYALLPVCIEGAFEIFPYNQKMPKLFCSGKKRKYTIKIIFKKPVYPKIKDVRILTEQLYAAVAGTSYETYEDMDICQGKEHVGSRSSDWLTALIQKYCPEIAITEESRLKEGLGFDSLKMYEIATEIEEKTHIDIVGQLEKIETVKDLRSLIF